MVRGTFFVGFALIVSGCAGILGNDYEVEGIDAAVGFGGAAGLFTTSSSSGPGGTGGAVAAGGSATGGTGGGSGVGGAGGDAGAGGAATTGGASGAGGTTVASGASGAGGSAMAGGASGASDTGGSGGTGGTSTSGGAAGSGLDASIDSGIDASGGATPDAGADTSTGVDAPPDTTTLDAPLEASSCNPLNGSCAGGLLTCNPNFSSCNGSNADGCECATPACCGASCQTQHIACMLGGMPSSPCTDGSGIKFYDCVALGTINSAQATKACAAVTGNVSACSPGACPGGHSDVCSFDGGGNCICWEYSGSAAGKVYKSLNTSCFCPTSTSPTWN